MHLLTVMMVHGTAWSPSSPEELQNDGILRVHAVLGLLPYITSTFSVREGRARAHSVSRIFKDVEGILLARNGKGACSPSCVM